jgi:hypothetical protein
MIKFGALLPWTGMPCRRVRREFPLTKEDWMFATEEMDRWVKNFFAEEMSEQEATQIGQVVSGFVVRRTKPRVVIDYTARNEFLENRKFRMETFADLAPQLKAEESLIKADVREAYYHL